MQTESIEVVDGIEYLNYEPTVLPEKTNIQEEISLECFNYLYSKYREGMRELGLTGDNIMPKKIFKLWLENTLEPVLTIEAGLERISSLFEAIFAQLLTQAETKEPVNES